MNIIMAVIGLVGLKRAPECIKMHHFEGENAKIFLGRGHSAPLGVASESVAIAVVGYSGNGGGGVVMVVVLGCSISTQSEIEIRLFKDAPNRFG